MRYVVKLKSKNKTMNMQFYCVDLPDLLSSGLFNVLSLTHVHSLLKTGSLTGYWINYKHFTSYARGRGNYLLLLHPISLSVSFIFLVMLKSSAELSHCEQRAQSLFTNQLSSAPGLRESSLCAWPVTPKSSS